MVSGGVYESILINKASGVANLSLGPGHATTPSRACFLHVPLSRYMPPNPS